jgi:predicted Holliday junction resolvase-like endonuclease
VEFNIHARESFVLLLLLCLLFVCLLFLLLPVLFVLCLKNSCGNHQINVEFKMKSIGIKEEIKKNRNTKGTQEIKVDFQIEIKVESSGFNKSKKKSKWN